MTAKELIKILSEVPEDTLIVMSSDAEGNRIGKMHCARVTHFVEDGYYHSYVGPISLSEEMRDEGYIEEDLLPEDAPLVVCLWPV